MGHLLNRHPGRKMRRGFPGRMATSVADIVAVLALVASLALVVPAFGRTTADTSDRGLLGDLISAVLGSQETSEDQASGLSTETGVSDTVDPSQTGVADGSDTVGDPSAVVDTVLQTAGYDYQERAVTQRGYYCDTADARKTTVMVYMCGADLESDDGSATEDLVEMQSADLSDDVNLIIETGGTSAWNNNLVDADTNTIWKLDSNGFQELSDLGLHDMTQPSTLQTFIGYAAENYPADRYILVLWDHGGGTLGGYGYDENYADSPSMSLSGIASALEGAQVKFDAIGFDACLMGSVGTAFALEPYADYLIGSERSEPGTGWDYTEWLSDLSATPAIPTADLGRTIVDGYIAQSVDYDPSSDATLSVIDLTQMPALTSALDTFFSDALLKIDGSFADFSKARSAASGGYGTEDDYDMIDLQLLAQNMGTEVPSYDQVVSAIADAVVYVDSVSCPTDENGINIDFPYSSIEETPYLISLYGELGFPRAYSAYLASFVSIMNGGQSAVPSDAGGGVTTVDNGGNNVSDSGIDSLSQDYYSYYSDLDNMLDGDQLSITQKGDGYVLSMSDDQWSLVTDVVLQVYLDNGYGYADMGTDNTYEFDSDGDLIIDFDGYWYVLDGQPVSFYFQSAVEGDDGSYTYYSTVPALVNQKQANVIVCWDSDHPDGYVQGYQYVYDNNLAARGTVAFQDGDVITYMCDCYDYDGNYIGTYNWADPVTYDGDIEVSTQSVEDIDAIICYKLTDIYGNQYITEPVSITYD